MTVKNFVDAEIDLNGGASTVTADGAMRGSISTGSADDKITVNAYSNTNDQNVIKIDSDGGNDTITFNGASNTKTSILSGDGADDIQIVLTGATSADVHVSIVNGNTVIDANGPGLITLEHVTNSAAVDIHFA